MALMLAPAATSALPANQETEHIVEAGETLNGIANRAGVPRDRVIQANGLEPPYVVRIGQRLRIPRATPGEGKAAQRTIPASPQGESLTASSSYVVQPGDTLGGIAIRAEIPRVLIAEANGLSSHDDIRVGQKLSLPRTKRHTVAAGETGFDISYKYAVPWEQIAIANGIEADGALPAGKVLLIPTIVDAPSRPVSVTAAPVVAAPQPKPANARFSWPLAGPIRRGFTGRGASDHHDGIDIAARRGDAVRAIAPGKVIFAQKDPDQFGNLVVVDHGDGWHSAYGSLQKITVKNGEDVFKGERVGLVGNTSITRQTELHFEIRKGGKPVDPEDYLPGQP
jgi:murein DD-endopeptidase MepM/ murein hydrolase activator NlpD